MKFAATEILVYALVMLSSLLMTAFVVHMLVGGLVNPEKEYMLMALACTIVAAAEFFMALDVIRQRRKKK